MAKRKTPGRERRPQALSLRDKVRVGVALEKRLEHLASTRATWGEAAFLLGKDLELEVTSQDLQLIARALGLDWARRKQTRELGHGHLPELGAAGLLALVEAVHDLYACAGEPMPAEMAALHACVMADARVAGMRPPLPLALPAPPSGALWQAAEMRGGGPDMPEPE